MKITALNHQAESMVSMTVSRVCNKMTVDLRGLCSLLGVEAPSRSYDVEVDRYDETTSVTIEVLYEDVMAVMTSTMRPV